MQKVTINTEFIKLDQFLKWAGACDTGAGAKLTVSQGLVKVNGNIELQRGKKIRKNDTVEYDGEVYVVE